MLKVKVELWPFGDEAKKRKLAEIDIWNRGTGDSWSGNYRFKAMEEESCFFKEIEVTGEVNNHNRKNPAIYLLYKVLEKVIKSIDEDVNS